MKHKLKITIILIAMFLTTQFIGLLVLHADPFHLETTINGTMQKIPNPAMSWIQPPEVKTQSESFSFLTSLVLAFIIAISLFFILTKLKIEFILRAWFFLVVSIALFISFYAFEKLVPFTINYYWALAIPILLSIPLAFVKIYQRNFLIHNLTELLIYPGLATVFVPILNIYTIIILLILISIYDMWAVWHSGIMQKMAKYQINKLNIFSGFFVPYVSKRVKSKIEKMKKTLGKAELKKKGIKVNVAILGGGDVIFPLITAGVVLATGIFNLPFGLKPFVGGILPALFVLAGATLGLTYLLIFSEKKKFYPAMPFITAGIFAGMILSWILL
ncbi:MAG: presenilin family intramembrane aspartyl protease [Nanoarchaeota archaeon]